MSITPEYHTLGKFNPEAAIAEPSPGPQAQLLKIIEAKQQELICAYERLARLEADLNECREYLEDEVDVVDGDYGEPAPNRAMQLVNMIDMTLHGPGGF